MIRELWTNAMLIATSLTLVVTMFLIQAKGSVKIQEPNPGILLLEILVLIVLIAFALANIISIWRRFRRER